MASNSSPWRSRATRKTGGGEAVSPPIRKMQPLVAISGNMVPLHNTAIWSIFTAATVQVVCALEWGRQGAGSGKILSVEDAANPREVRGEFGTLLVFARLQIFSLLPRKAVFDNCSARLSQEDNCCARRQKMESHWVHIQEDVAYRHTSQASYKN